MSFPCGICELTTSNTKSLLCRICNIWYHADCEEVSKTLFGTLDKNRNLAYTCRNCVKNPQGDSINAFKSELRSEFATLKNFINDLKADQQIIKSKIDSVACDIRKELMNGLKEMKDDVNKCSALINSNDTAYKNKFYELELQNHVLQHRINRADIVISGLPSDNNLNSVVMKLCSFLKIDVADSGIINTTYIRHRNAVLVKFADISKRDRVVSEYFKRKFLKASDFIDGAAESRVYINDNFTSLANKLFKICWKLKKEEKIKGYVPLNREKLLAKVTFLDGSVKSFKFHEFFNYFNIYLK